VPVGILEAIILGLVQGLTEFLPISSSAHLRIVGEFFGTHATDPGAAFTAITQLGTESAVIIYFWPDIRRIVSKWARSLVGRVPRTDHDARMGWFIILGSVPIVVLGLLFQTAIETTLRSLWIVATTLILFGILLGVADVVGSKQRRLKELTWQHAIIYGLAQALALIPGVSRSGGTITAGLLMGYTREAAAKYSFLLAIPAVFASGFLEVLDIGDEQAPAWGPTIVATVISFLVGYVVIVYFMRWIAQHDFRPLVVYRALLGAGVLTLLAFGVLMPYG
jgi:undecaprenyl-diphosphatase